MHNENNEPSVEELVTAFRVEIALSDPPSWVSRDNVIARYEEYLRQSEPDHAAWFKRTTLEYISRYLGRPRD